MYWRTNDLFAGFSFLGVAALFGITALKTLNVGTVGTMGPGFFPIMMSLVLAVLGLAVIVGARGREKEAAGRPISWRAVIFLFAAPIAFALTVRNFGLVPALVISTTLAVLASRKIRFVQGALIVVGLTAFCAAIFSYGIGLTIELFIRPPWL